MIGLGYHDTVTPGVIKRNVLENPAWYTAYTPYQPEISQGRLEALLNFQTMVADLTGLDIANASPARRGHRRRRGDGVGRAAPPTAEVAAVRRRRRHPAADHRRVRTRAEPLGIEVRRRRPARTGAADRRLLRRAAVSTRARPARIRDLRRAGRAKATRAGPLVAVAADLLALTLLTPPGEIGRRRRGRHRPALRRAARVRRPARRLHGGARRRSSASCPAASSASRIDAAGDPAYRLALQTREQHIRREKATSNICTAQVLLAVIAGMYAV